METGQIIAMTVLVLALALAIGLLVSEFIKKIRNDRQKFKAPVWFSSIVETWKQKQRIKKLERDLLEKRLREELEREA